MKTLTLLQSAPIIGPLGWAFALVAIAAIGLLVRLWHSLGNKERLAMERELKAGREQLIKWRTEVSTLGLRNNVLANEKNELEAIIKKQSKRIAEVASANELLRVTEQQQSMLITALTNRVARNEKLIIKLYTDLGRDIDLRHIGGMDSSEAPPPGTSE